MAEFTEAERNRIDAMYADEFANMTADDAQLLIRWIDSTARANERQTIESEEMSAQAEETAATWADAQTQVNTLLQSLQTDIAIIRSSITAINAIPNNPGVSVPVAMEVDNGQEE